MSNQKKPKKIVRNLVIMTLPLLIIAFLFVKCQLGGGNNLGEKKIEGALNKPHALIEFQRRQDNSRDILKEISVYPSRATCTTAAFDAMDRMVATNETIQNVFLKFRYACDSQ